MDHSAPAYTAHNGAVVHTCISKEKDAPSVIELIAQDILLLKQCTIQ